MSDYTEGRGTDMSPRAPSRAAADIVASTDTTTKTHLTDLDLEILTTLTLMTKTRRRRRGRSGVIADFGTLPSQARLLLD